MSPAWWEGRPELAENTPEGRALRLLRRFLSKEQLQSFDDLGYFTVQGKKNEYLFLAGQGLTYRLASRLEAYYQLRSPLQSVPLNVTHQLCIYPIEDLPPMTIREYYRMNGILERHSIIATEEELNRVLPEMYRFIHVPLYDKMLGNKLLIENDEELFLGIAIKSPMVPQAIGQPFNAQDVQAILLHWT